MRSRLGRWRVSEEWQNEVTKGASQDPNRKLTIPSILTGYNARACFSAELGEGNSDGLPIGSKLIVRRTWWAARAVDSKRGTEQSREWRPTQTSAYVHVEGRRGGCSAEWLFDFARSIMACWSGTVWS